MNVHGQEHRALDRELEAACGQQADGEDALRRRRARRGRLRTVTAASAWYVTVICPREGFAQRRHHLAFADLIFRDSISQFVESHHGEWNGRMQRVAVLAEGFAWNGQTYASLPKVALAITATRWSGPKFFGLRDKPSKGSSA